MTQFWSLLLSLWLAIGPLCAPEAWGNLHGLSRPAALIFEDFLRSPSGRELGLILLGRPGGALNPHAAAEEVLASLLQPRNDRVYRQVVERLDEIGTRARSLNEEMRGVWLEREFASQFHITRAGADRVQINQALYPIEVYPSAQARRAEFLMAGQRVLAGSQRGQVVRAPALAPPSGPGSEFSRRLHRDPFEQFLRWEERANLRPYGETTQFFPLEMMAVPRGEVQVETARFAPPGVLGLLSRGDQILWPRHPYNQYLFTAYRGSPVVETWPGRMTASRSIVVWDRAGGIAFSLKVGTNYAHRTHFQPNKLRSENDVEDAVFRSDMIARMNAEAGGRGAPDLILLREVASFLAPTRAGVDLQARGVVVRDLSPLLDGHYYLPAFSLQFVGRSIARHLGISFENLWRSSYAEALGRAKAQLLLYYTLQMETPNTQNVLIQLDRSLRPTGKLVLRDVADSLVVEPLAQARGESVLLARERGAGNAMDGTLRLETENSFWRLDEDQEHHIPRATLEAWKQAHDRAFVGEVLRLLRLEELPNGTPGLANLGVVSREPGAPMATEAPVCASSLPTVSELEAFLFSPSGLEAYRRFIHLPHPVSHSP